MNSDDKQLEQEQDELQKAKVLLSDTLPEKREKGWKLLRRLSTEAVFNDIQVKVNQLLADYKGSIKEEKIIPLYITLSGILSGVSKLGDTRLLGLIKQLSGNSVVAVQMRSDFISTIRPLIKREIEKETFSKDAITHFANVIKAIREIELYAMDLHDDLAGLNTVIRKYNFNKARPEVETALRLGDVASSWEFIDEYRKEDGLPDEITDYIESLKQKVILLQEAITSAQSLIGRKNILDEIKSWAQCKEIYRYYTEIDQILNEDGLPSEQMAELAALLKKSSGIIKKFLEIHAKAISTLSLMKDFWNEYSQLIQSKEFGKEFEIPEDWFKNFEKTFLTDLQKNVHEIPSPKELNNYLSKLEKEISSFSKGQSFITSLMEELESLAQSWENMQNGQEFSNPSTRFQLPRVFSKERIEYNKLLKEVESENERLQKAQEEANEIVLEEIILKAKEILGSFPNHILAAKLKSETENLIIGYKIDKAVSRWNLAELKELIKSPNNKTFYYCENLEIIGELKRLAKQPAYGSWSKAAQWWNEWRKKKGELHLDTETPTVMQTLLRLEEEKRIEKWLNILDKLENGDYEPEEFDRVADSLESEAGNIITLKSYQEIFKRKSLVIRINRKIIEKERDEARKLLESLDNSPEKERLHILLELEDARETGIEQLAGLLEEKWGQIQNNYNKSEHLLLDTFESAWRQRKYEIIRKNLIPLIDRVTLSKKDSTALQERLEDWSTWFKLVEKGRSSEAENVLPELYRYTKENKSVKDKGLLQQKIKEELVNYWEQKKDIVPLIWAQIVWEESVVITNPLHQLIQDTKTVAAKASNTVDTDSKLSIHQVKSLLDELKQKDSVFKQISEVLTLSENQSSKVTPPKDLIKSIHKLTVLLEAIETLERSNNTDLREPRAKQAFGDAIYNLRENLRGVAIRDHLLLQEPKLEPLTNLQIIEKHIKESALDCGNEELWWKPDLFEEVRKNLLELTKVFEKAELLNGYMWQKVSNEYSDFIFEKGCLLIPMPDSKDIGDLIKLLAKVVDKEKILRDQIIELWDKKPPVGEKFEEHHPYLEKFPKEPPAALRNYIFFEKRFAKLEAGQQLLKAARQWLPEWIIEYLDGGVPECGTN